MTAFEYSPAWGFVHTLSVRQSSLKAKFASARKSRKETPYGVSDVLAMLAAFGMTLLVAGHEKPYQTSATEGIESWTPAYEAAAVYFRCAGVRLRRCKSQVSQRRLRKWNA
jgi:hypothetical protein